MRKAIIGGLIALALGFGAADRAKAEPITDLDLTMTNDASLVWGWMDQYNMQSSASTGGSVSGDTNGYYDVNTSITLNASPDQNYKFVSWANVPSGLETNQVLNFDITNAWNDITASFGLVDRTCTVDDGGYGVATPGTTNVTHGATLRQSRPAYIDLGNGKRMRANGYTLTGVDAVENP